MNYSDYNKIVEFIIYTAFWLKKIIRMTYTSSRFFESRIEIRMKILIIGINGFIGHRLAENILSKTDWEIYGMDISSHRLEHCLRYSSRLHFKPGDMTKEEEWIRKQLKICDVVIPLAAITSTLFHTKDPIKVFELNFEANLEIIKLAYEAKKHLIFPSTSEVYGLCQDLEFDEQTSNLVLGPIQEEQWIYSASKQLLERIIYGYKHRGLKFTLFRLFNWVGPKQDELFVKNTEHSHVISRLISRIIHNQDIILFHEGNQRVCFIYIDDSIEALLKMIQNKNECAEGKIFNIGNPNNSLSVRELAEKIIEIAMTYPKYHDLAEQTKIICMDEKECEESTYQDSAACVPSIKQAKKYLGWYPKTDIDITLNNTLAFYLG
jgi:nucleoside-diphosphate-sugar epimerase